MAKHRYAIRAEKDLNLSTYTTKRPVNYIARAVGLNSEGGLTPWLDEAKTFASAASAERWMSQRPDWRTYREREGWSLSAVPVRMARESKITALYEMTGLLAP